MSKSKFLSSLSKNLNNSMSKYNFLAPWVKLDSSTSALATIRYKYFYDNYKNLQKTNNIFDQYSKILSKATVYDNSNPLHQKIFRDMAYQRQLVKYNAQEITKIVSPESISSIADRGSRAADPDTPGVMDDVMKKLGPKYDKSLTFGKLIEKSFTPDGKDMPTLKVKNIFADTSLVTTEEIRIEDPSYSVSKFMVDLTNNTTDIIDITPANVLQCLYNVSYKDGLITNSLADIAVNKILTESEELNQKVEGVLIDSTNKAFDDAIKSIDDITPNALVNISRLTLQEAMPLISGLIQNTAMSTIETHNSSDPVVVKTRDTILTKLDKYISNTITKANGSAVSNFTKGHAGELQQKLVSISQEITSTQDEINNKQSELNTLNNNPDPTLSPAEIAARKVAVQSEISIRTKAIEDATDIKDTLNPTSDEIAKKEAAYEKEKEEAWHPEVPEIRPFTFLMLATEANVTEDAVIKIFDGNLLSQIEQYVLSIQATLVSEQDDNIGALYRNYKINESQVEVMLVEDQLFGDNTIISSDNSTLLGNVVDYVNSHTST